MQSHVAKRNKLLNITAAAKILGVHRVTLGVWIRDNVGPPSIRLGKRRYFTREIIEQWLRAHSSLA